MTYLEYERFKVKYDEMQEIFAQILMEKERLFTKTLPNAIRYDRDQVQTSISGNPLEEYVVSMDEKKIDEKLSKTRESLKDWEILLKIKEKELRASHAIPDRIYVYRYIDGYGINKIAKTINYSKSQVYRILNQIDKKMRQNAKIDVI